MKKFQINVFKADISVVLAGTRLEVIAFMLNAGSPIFKFYRLFVCLFALGSVWTEPVKAEIDFSKPAEFLKRYVDESGDPKPLSKNHEAWLIRASKKQHNELLQFSKDKKAGLLSQAKKSGESCQGFKEFDPQFSDQDFNECRKFMNEVASFLIQSIEKMPPEEIEFAFGAALMRLEAAAQGKSLSPQDELNLFKSSKIFQNQVAQMTTEDRKEMEKLFKLYENPDFVKALESGDSSKVLEFLQKNQLEIPPELLKP